MTLKCPMARLDDIQGQVVKGSMFKGGVGSTRSSAAKKSSAGETFASREFDVKLS